jgi:hypothetical protein
LAEFHAICIGGRRDYALGFKPGTRWAKYGQKAGDSAMTTNTFRKSKRRSEAGQVILFVLLGLGLFLIGAMAFAIDLSYMWFHRQTAQTAADAACTAGAIDWLRIITDGVTAGNFTPGTNFNCNSTTPNANTPGGTTNPVPCVYAALNGYPSTITKANAAAGVTGDNVDVIFNGTAPPGVGAANVMEVDITENFPAFFLPLLQGKTSQTIRAVAKCGIESSAAPIPLLVLDPVNPSGSTSAFNITGNPDVTIYGGPVQSIQVNSQVVPATSIGGNALVDLRQGGPQTNGSSFGSSGGPLTPPTCSLGGSTPNGFCTNSPGQWMNSSPISDPLQNVVEPTSPGGAAPATLSVADGTADCSSVTASGNPVNCDEFLPGYYPNGICVKGGGGCGSAASTANGTAIFREGLYYLGGDLSADSSSCLRVSTNTSSGSNHIGGVIFYFASGATLNFASNTGGRCDPNQKFNTNSGSGILQFGVACDSNSLLHVPTNLPAQLTGNVLLAPCTGTYGDPSLAAGNTPPSNPGQQRGILFFQSRSATSVAAKYGGQGAYAMAGTMYFHSCKSGIAAGGTATNCDTTSGNYFTDSILMDGGTGTSAYVLGEIITDNLHLQGQSSIYMDLSPTSVLNVYKASLYQ